MDLLNDVGVPRPAKMLGFDGCALAQQGADSSLPLGHHVY